MPSFSELLKGLSADWQASLQRLQLRYNRLSWARALVFLLGAAFTWWVFRWDPLTGILAGAGVLIGFLYLLKVHTEVAEARDLLQHKLRLLEEEERIAAWQWLDRDPGQAWMDPHHAFSYDLDLFGRGSLYQYLHRHGTAIGGERLAQWLQSPLPDAGQILEQQAAVQELAPEIAWQLHFQALGQQSGLGPQRPDSLLAWMKEPLFYLPKTAYRWALWLMPGAFLLAVSLWALGSFAGGPAIPGWLPVTLFLLNLAFTGKEMGRISRQQQAFARQAKLLQTYAALLKLIESSGFQASWFQQRKQQLSSQETSASEAIARLGELLYRLDQRLNIAAALLLNGAWLWDIRYMRRLEAWKERYQEHLPLWLEVLADVDALNGLARTTAARPDLHFPEVVSGEFNFLASQLGHLLIEPGIRVDNNVEWRKPGEFLVVTGANMAGKSTFLRAVGTNLLLAHIGAPVCAAKLRLSPVRLMTSIRATDSLTDHESFFYAELKRLKMIMDELRASPPVFVIVDEMLRGTNSRDKQEGSRGFIEQLIEAGGVGMVATHDLSLGQLAEAYPGQVRNKRFEVDIRGDQLRFDYLLLDGISQKLNATFLMQQMGIMKRAE